MCSTLNHLFVVLLTCFAGNKDVEPRFGNGCTAAVTEGSSLVNVYIHRLQFSMGVFNTKPEACNLLHSNHYWLPSNRFKKPPLFFGGLG